MTVDTRYPNSHLLAIAGCLPILEVTLQHLKLASVFAILDVFKGFWQFLLHVDCSVACKEVRTLLMHSKQGRMNQ